MVLPHFNLVTIYTNLGYLDEATQALEEAARRYPQSVWIWIRRATIEQRRGNLQEAVTILQMGLTRHPSEHGLWGMLASIYRDLGDLQKAIEASQRSIDLAPENPWDRLTMSGLQEQMGNLERAEAELLLAIRYLPDWQEVDPLMHLGDLQGSQGRREEAIATYCQALLMDRWHRRPEELHQRLRNLDVPGPESPNPDWSTACAGEVPSP